MKSLIKEWQLIYKGYLRRFLPEDKSAKIIDLGCGFGGFLYFLNQEGYTNTMGIDCSQEQIDLACKLGLRNVFCADILETLIKHPQEFDFIAAIDVLEHFKKEEILKLFEAVYNALKPGGIFVVKSPNGESPLSNTYLYMDFTHETIFTKSSIYELFLRFGFQQVRVYPTGPIVHGPFSFMRYIIWQIFRYILIFYSAVETGCFNNHIFTLNLIAVGRRSNS
jgi:SAM-dependent methyltransferase